MAENAVYVEIIGRDLMSPLIDNLLGRMNGVGAAADNFWGALGAEVFVRGIDLAIDRVRALTSALGEAASIETQQIAAASDIATNLGISMEQSRSMVTSIAKQIATVAASLPGETQGYAEIFNAISGAVSDQIKDPEEFQRTAIELTKRIGALAAIRGQSTADAGSQAMRLMAGTVGYGEARASFDFLQKNPMLQRAIERQAAALGTSVEDWKTMSADMRLQIFQKALSEAAPDQLFESFKGSAEDYIQTLRTRFFDPSLGIFGMMREVSTRGNRTVLDAAKGSLAAFSELLDSLGSLDWAFDPLAGLIDFLDGVAGFFTRLSRMLAGGNGSFELPEISADAIRAMGDAFGAMLVSGVQKLGEIYNSIDWTGIGSYLLPVIAAIGQVMGNMPHYFARMIEEVDWIGVGAAIGQVVVWGLVAGAAFLWEYIPRFITGLTRLFIDIVGVIGGLIVGAIWGVGKRVILEFVRDFTDFWEWLTTPFDTIRTAVESAIAGIRAFFDRMTSAVSAAGSGIRQFADNTIGRIPGLGRVFDNPNAAPEAGGTAEPPLPNVAPGNTPVTAQPVAVPATSNTTTNAATFAPQVNVSAGTNADANAIGEAIVSRLNALYRQYSEGALA